METVSLAEKFARIHDHWHPRIVGALNGQHVKLAKVRGEFVWHSHADADELFLVHRGHLAIELHDRTLHLGPGEFCIVPRGVEHRPVAEEEVELVLFEPAGTRNTGEVTDEKTVEEPEWI